MSNTVFFFGYSWNARRKLDAYQTALVKEFTNQGFDVRVYHSNTYSNRDALYGVFREFEKSIIADIKKYQPCLVVSMNQGLISNAICDAVPESSDIYTWIVDDPAHYFYPNIQEKTFEIRHEIHPRIKVMVFASNNYEYFKKHCIGLKPENLLLVTSVTDFSEFRKVPFVPKRNIVFVGSYLDTGLAVALLKDVNKDQKLRMTMMSILKKMTVDYLDDSFPEYKDPLFIDFLDKHDLNLHQFKHIFSNLISVSVRVNGVRALKDLGMEVFGNLEWIDGLATDFEALQCFQSRSISSRADLVELYQSSKISIQLVQVQAGTALSYRIFDILASDSLLIHPYAEGSDLYHFFGKDCPVPVYKTMEELRALCKYYLENEEERKKVVKRCQDMVQTGYSFYDRVLLMLNGRKGKSTPGKIIDERKTRMAISVYGTCLFALRIMFENPRQGIHLSKRKTREFLNGSRLK